MKRKKMSARRLLARVMIMALLAACMSEMAPVQVSAEKASGYFKYVVLDDGTAMITGITDSAVASIQSTGKITIPDVIDGYAVTQLGAQSMSWTNIQKYLETVIISEGITTIGTKAFYSLTSLSFVSLPSTLRVMNDQCFSETALVSVTIPASIERYGVGVFAFCKSLETVIVPEGAESLGASIFYKCTELENVQLPASMKKFGDYAFAGCSALEEIDIPSAVADFGPGAFFQTKWLDKKRLERGDHLVIVNDIVIDGYLCTGDVVVPEGVKAVAAAAFAYGIKDECPGAAVASVWLPSSVTSIGMAAFYGCPNLADIHLPEGLRAIPDMLLENCSALEELVLPETVISIGNSAFAGCTSLAKLTLSDSLESVEAGAFPEGQGLMLVIPEGLTDIRGLGLEKLSGVVFCVVEGGSVADFLIQNNIINFTTYAAAEPGPAEETPEPAEETPGVTEETPNPAEETPGVTEETPNPAEETPGVTEETPNPAKETLKPAEETPGVTEETPNPAEGTPKPVDETLEPAEETPGVTEETPNPAKETLKPAEETPEVTEETPNPAEETLKPAEETPGVTEETPNPAEETPEPAKETPEPAEETPGVTEKTPEPQKPPAHITEEQKSQAGRQDIYEKGKVYTAAKKRYRITSRNTVAFAGCVNASVRKLTVPASIRLGSKTYRVTAIEAGACKGNGKLQKVVIGKNVKTVGASAFRNCKKLTRLTYGAGVVAIQKNGLRGDVSLKTVTIKSRKLKQMGKAVFRRVPSSLTVKVPKNKLRKYKKMIQAAR